MERYYDDLVTTRILPIEACRPIDSQTDTACQKRVTAKALDKDRCVTAHEDSRYQDRIQRSTHLPHIVTSILEEPPPASVPLSSLKEITLPELIVNKRHCGTALFGKLCVVPFKISSVNTVLEDATGRGVAVVIYNYFPSTASTPETEAHFSFGTRVAIKEPFFKICADGKTAVRVDNPADICIVDNHEDDISKADLTAANVAEDLETIRSEGNGLFSRRNWTGAETKYSQCINQALRVTQEEGMTNISNPDKVRSILMLAYTNRAEARLRLQAYEDALSDAEKALEFDPKHVKTLVRKGRAADGLGLFEQSCKVFKAALEQSPQEQSIVDYLKASTTFYLQSRNGAFDLSDYYLTDCKGAYPPLTDFVGPVEIGRVPYGCGRRGMFVTRRVEAGELLLVSNPVAMIRQRLELSHIFVNIKFKKKGTAKGSVNSGNTQDLVTKLAHLVLRSKRHLAQLNSLAVPGKEEMEIPSMELFRPGSNWVPPDADKLQVDIGLIQEIVRVNSFGNDDDHLGKIKQRMEMGDHAARDVSSGLWLLPSFANHACAPNCLTTSIGDTMFFRAYRDMKKGEEVTIPYFDGLFQTVDSRQALAAAWSFACQCERCRVEESLKPQLSSISKAVRRLAVPTEAESRKEGHEQWARNQLAKIANQVETVVSSSENKLDSLQQSWIRAAFLPVYLSKRQLAAMNEPNSLQDVESRMSTLRVMVDSMASVWAGAEALRVAALLLLEVEAMYSKQSQIYRLTEKRVLGIYKAAFGNQPNRILHCLVRFRGLPSDSTSALQQCLC